MSRQVRFRFSLFLVFSVYSMFSIRCHHKRSLILFSLHKNHLVRRKNSVEIMIPENQAYFTKRKADTSAARTARVLHERH